MAKYKRTRPKDIVQYKGKNCSRIYARMLTMAEEDGVHFTLNSGFRSISEQWVLYKLYRAGKGALAAFPGNSTHNKKGWKQGLDIRWDDGGCSRLRLWAKAHGMDFDLTVAGEKWHINARQNYSEKLFIMWQRHLRKLKVEEQRKQDNLKRKRRPTH